MMNEREQKALEIEQKQREDDLLKIHDGPDRVISFPEMADIISKFPKGNPELNTHLGTLNTMTGGLREGNLICVSGHTGEGKTQFCQDLTLQFSKKGIGCLWFTFEMTESELLERYGTEIPDTAYLPAELKSSSMDWMKKRIRESILKYNTKVVFIDHLHFMIGMRDLATYGDNLSIFFGMVTQELKNIAIENKLVIVFIVHPKKNDIYQALTIDDVGRDSSLITANADLVLTLWRDKRRTTQGPEYNENTFLNILKNRRKGKMGKIQLAFNNGSYEEFDPMRIKLP